MKEFVFWRKKETHPWFTYFQNAGKYWNSFKTNLLNIIFDNFSKWL